MRAGVLLAIALGLTLPAVLLNPSAAEPAEKSILVLDASGSMWGQIDGVNKITIAREVVRDLLKTFPSNQELGLTVYGHREKGSCTDIETLVEPSLQSRDSIAKAVAGINPKGMTPMADAVTEAANSMRHTETRATVILISDGIETCNPDPCGVARVLEETGVC
jgi:Ca-activated chloride channel family protein